MISTIMLAQPPQGISHQAVIRDAHNELVANSQIGIRVSILQGSAGGDAVYVETHTPISNANGLITYIIGEGVVVSGLFAEIDWSELPYFLKTEADPTGGDNYTISGVTQFLSVPYALHAHTANELTSEIEETQSLSDVLLIDNSANSQIKSLEEPTDAADAATKAYVDLLASYVDSLLERIEALEDAILPPLTDIDGNVYQTVIIGNQEWMAENLKVTRDAAGNSITRHCYDSDVTNCELYGGLYTWDTAMNMENSSNENPSGVQGICPDGWHVPSDAEWTQMVNYLMTEHNWTNNWNDVNGLGNKLKSCRQINSPLGGDCDTTEHPRWDAHPIHFGTDEVGLSMLPGGFLCGSGECIEEDYGFWWSSTQRSDAEAFNRTMGNNLGSISAGFNYKDSGFSLRCLRDASN